MEDTIYPNDIVLVNKLIYNFQSVKQGDIFVFRLVNGGFIVKRCVGNPGEFVKLINGEVYINNVRYKSPMTVKMNYEIQLSDKRNFYSYLDSIKTQNPIYFESTNRYIGVLSKKEIESISSFPHVKNVRKVLYGQGRNLFFSQAYPIWNLDNFGPIKVPNKGMAIVLNKLNYLLYKNVLSEYENLNIKEDNGHYYANGKEIKKYIFKSNYYFVLGDNREFSADSRSFGFVSEKYIVGKVNFIIFSYRYIRLGIPKAFTA